MNLLRIKSMLDRKTPPKHTETNSFKLPAPEIFTLASGVSLILLRGVTQQVLKIELIFDAGKWVEPKSGLSYFTSLMLEKGTASKTSYEIADFFDRHGASIEISPGFDFVSVSLFSLTKNINQVLPVFLELVTASVFPEDELILQKDIYNQNLKINSEKTSFVASKLIRQHLFGNSHPYGRSVEENDVNQINPKNLSEFFHDHFSLIQVFVVGSLDDPLLSILISELAIIPKAINKNNPLLFSINQNESSDHLEKPGSIQSSLRLGKRIIRRDHEDYPSLVLVNHILGGYFGSRLMKNVREDKGLTYGIYSSLNNFRNDSFFVIGADVNKINKDLALQEIKNELNQLYNSLISDQELQNAKSHLLGSLQLEIANPFSVIEKIKTIQLQGLSDDFYNDLFLKILALNKLTIQETAAKYLSNSFTEIAVG